MLYKSDYKEGEKESKIVRERNRETLRLFVCEQKYFPICLTHATISWI